jgi:hypothetical protein
MISDEKINNIRKDKIKKGLILTIDYIIFILLYVVSYKFEFQFNEDRTLFNDKLIDVCSIFFGVFVGCIFLFEKFKKADTYTEFINFSRNLLFLNLLIIALSFVIILINPILAETSEFIISWKPKVLLFSIYVSLFGVVIYKIFRFVKMMIIVIRAK